MWARDSEIFIAIWLAISWLIFQYPESTLSFLLIHDFVCCILIMIFALVSYIPKMHAMHLFNFVMGIWLIGFTFNKHVDAAAQQNYAVLGLLLLMVSIVPSFTEDPPADWYQFMKHRKK